MTPLNLVRMAALWAIEVIALTDHNTVGNCRSAIAVGETVGVTVIPGMELCTSEEIHVICLFPGIEQAEAFGQMVASTLPPVKNKPKIFGEQLYMDAKDKVLGHEEILLVTASSISIEEAPALCRQFGGVCFPAHIDRTSYSILSALGLFPAHLGFSCAEVLPKCAIAALTAQHPPLEGLRLLRSSDAHYLDNMAEAADTIEAEQSTAAAVIAAIKRES